MSLTLLLYLFLDLFPFDTVKNLFAFQFQEKGDADQVIIQPNFNSNMMLTFSPLNLQETVSRENLRPM